MAKTKRLVQRIKINAEPKKIYEILMDSKKHSKLIGSPAKMSKKIGAKISAFSGWVQGENLELIPNKKIVQTWRGKDWIPKDHFSEIVFSLKKVKGGTKINFTQKDLPLHYYNDVKQGWHEYYWQPMKKMLG